MYRKQTSIRTPATSIWWFWTHVAAGWMLFVGQDNKRMNSMNEWTVILCRQCSRRYCRRCLVELSAVPPRPPASPVAARSDVLVRSAERGRVAELLRPPAVSSTLSSRGWRRPVDRDDDPSWWCRVDGGGAELDVAWGWSPTPRWPDAAAADDEEKGRSALGRDDDRRSEDAVRDDDTGPAAAAAGWRQSAGTYPRLPPSSSA